mgnify:CR=1 FL=1
MYESCIKRLLDLILSLAACVVLAIPMGIIALWIKKDSPGPVFFKQRRVGRGKGQMSIIGPRPALYNQYDLIAARDAVHANDIRPGLTGLAQINGRDELPIDVKARYDGEYAADITFLNDAKIFLHSITYVFQRRGVVEGGTGTMQQAENSQKKQK